MTNRISRLIGCRFLSGRVFGGWASWGETFKRFLPHTPFSNAHTSQAGRRNRHPLPRSVPVGQRGGQSVHPSCFPAGRGDGDDRRFRGSWCGIVPSCRAVPVDLGGSSYSSTGDKGRAFQIVAAVGAPTAFGPFRLISQKPSEKAEANSQ